MSSAGGSPGILDKFFLLGRSGLIYQWQRAVCKVTERGRTKRLPAKAFAFIVRSRFLRGFATNFHSGEGRVQTAGRVQESLSVWPMSWMSGVEDNKKGTVLVNCGCTHNWGWFFLGVVSPAFNAIAWEPICVSTLFAIVVRCFLERSE